MKAHLTITLKESLTRNMRIPFWMTFIQDKSVIVEQFDNELDQIFSDYGIKIWITRQYDPAEIVRHPSSDFSILEKAQGLDRTYRVILQEEAEITDELLQKIRLVDAVYRVEPITVIRSEMPQLSRSHAISDLKDKGRSSMFLKEAKVYSKGDQSIKIAILDTGVDVEHPELKHAIEKSVDFVNMVGLDSTDFIGDYLGRDEDATDEQGHGSGVAGQIIGKGINMPEGVVPDCKILAVRVLATMVMPDGTRVGAGLIDNINSGIKWAVDNGADIINMSLGVRHENGGLPHEDVIKYALSKGVIIVAAAGNDGTNDKYYPGALPGVIAVGAVDENDKPAAFSSYGAHVSIAAPGVDIVSTSKNHSYSISSGTSQAAPFIAGGVALMLSYAKSLRRKLSISEVTAILKNTADKPDNRFRNDKTGHGRINMLDALKQIKHQFHNIHNQ